VTLLAVRRPRAGIDSRPAIASSARQELAALWRLYASDTVPEMYSPDNPGAVLVLEAESIAAAQVALDDLPRLAHEIVDFGLIELRPFAAFAARFATPETP
jgi:hypothetical protein